MNCTKIYENLITLSNDLRTLEKEMSQQKEMLYTLQVQIETIFDLLENIQSMCEPETSSRNFRSNNIYEH